MAFLVCQKASVSWGKSVIGIGNVERLTEAPNSLEFLGGPNREFGPRKEFTGDKNADAHRFSHYCVEKSRSRAWLSPGCLPEKVDQE